ncbi:MAG: alanine--tRNA ligase, partial [Proteobacteria bacterium]|nr:alanine--tRNA ligase [Pseudomonadota bacterium]
VFDIMKPVYPELSSAASFITNIIKNEEVRFSETLDKGLKLLNDNLLEIKAKGQKEIPGQLIFKLYDTYGFPLDIVRDVVRDKNMSLDIQGFNNAMEEQRAKSRSIATFSEISDAYKKLSSEGIKPKFVGYDKLSCNAKVLVIVENGNEVHEASSGKEVEVITDFTPFYAESGGQVGDTGKISGTNLLLEISDTVKDPTGLVIHKGRIISGTIKKGDNIFLIVDKNERNATACNHTATHILHSVLRQILGDHVKQAGSLVAPDRLRFDFTHFSQVDTETLDKIESLVNKIIQENMPVQLEEMDAEDALKTGATALFEEKYGDRVRVVSLSDFSKELCGGIHTRHTGNIGLFKIIGESSVASGVRRIEALTGDAALTYTQKTSNIVRNIARLVKEKPEALTQRVEKILSEQKFHEKEIERLKAQTASRSADRIEDDIKSINNIKVLAKKVSVDNPAALRDLADKFKEKIKSGIVVLGCNTGPKVLLITLVTKDLVDRFHAGNIVKQVAAIVGGGGGGRPDMAQAGGTKPEMLDKALDKVYELVENR